MKVLLRTDAYGKKNILREDQIRKYEKDNDKIYRQRAFVRSLKNEPENAKLVSFIEKKMYDKAWGFLNKRGISLATEGMWGLYRNNLMRHAELLECEEKYERALYFYAQVMYLDYVGVQNTGTAKLVDFGGNGGVENLLPHFFAKIEEMLEEGIAEDKFREIFDKATGVLKKSLRIKEDPEKLWEIINSE